MTSITVSDLKALLAEMPEHRTVNLTLTLHAPEHIEAEVSRLRADLQYARSEADNFARENEYLRDLLHDIGVEDPDTLNQQHIVEIRQRVEGYRGYKLTDRGRQVAKMLRE